MIIERLQLNEIDAAADVIATVFKEENRAKAAKEFTRFFNGEDHPTYVFVAKIDDKVVGLVGCLELYFNMDVYGIGWVGVREEFRRQGIAAALIKAAESFIKIDLLQGEPGTILITAPDVDYYIKLGYAKQLIPIHDDTDLMMKIVNT